MGEELRYLSALYTLTLAILTEISPLTREQFRQRCHPASILERPQYTISAIVNPAGTYTVKGHLPLAQVFITVRCRLTQLLAIYRI